MLAQTGLFDESLFLYHEDTDLGLRGCWMGWHCLYVPQAEVEHWYSASAGRASAAKAWYVERNRLRVVLKLFPFTRLVIAPVYAAARYALHVRAAWLHGGVCRAGVDGSVCAEDEGERQKDGPVQADGGA